MAELFTPEVLASFAALTFLEIVLGIDNIVCLAVAVGRLPAAQQKSGRQIGLWMAMGLRILMLFGLVWITKLDTGLFALFGARVHDQGPGADLRRRCSCCAKGTMGDAPPDRGRARRQQGGRAAPAVLAAAMVQIALIHIVVLAGQRDHRHRHDRQGGDHDRRRGRLLTRGDAVRRRAGGRGSSSGGPRPRCWRSASSCRGRRGADRRRLRLPACRASTSTSRSPSRCSSRS